MSGNIKHYCKADRKRHTVNSNHIKGSQKAQCQAENEHTVPILFKDELLVPKYNKQEQEQILGQILSLFVCLFPKDSVALLSES